MSFDQRYALGWKVLLLGALVALLMVGWWELCRWINPIKNGKDSVAMVWITTIVGLLILPFISSFFYSLFFTTPNDDSEQ